MSLVLENVTKNFGGLCATNDVSFSVGEKVIFGLIGPNGAGKTTVFNLITGVYKHDAGAIHFGARDLKPLRPAEVAGVGIARTFQNIRLFGQLTVIENLLVACELQKKAHLAAAILRLPAHYEDERTMQARALELLRVFDLHAMAHAAPTSLSYGNQRRLEIARAMMLRPKLLLLDEPAAGMNYGEAEGLKTQIRWLRDTFDLAVVLVEHNMQVVMGVCEEIHVLDHGETIAHGVPEAIVRDPKVIAAYLGEPDADAVSVRAVAEEAAHSLVPPPVRSLTPSPPSSRPVIVAKPIAKPIVVPLGDVPRKLSDADLADLSKELVAKLEHGLSQPGGAVDGAIPDLTEEPTNPATTTVYEPPTTVAPASLEALRALEAAISEKPEEEDETATKLLPSESLLAAPVVPPNPRPLLRRIDTGEPIPRRTSSSQNALKAIKEVDTRPAFKPVPLPETPLPESTPNLGSLDTGWGSERKVGSVPEEDTDPDVKSSRTPGEKAGD